MPPEVYILEHYYCKKSQLSSFLLRDPTGQSKRHYSISILNREEEANRVTLESTVSDFIDTPRIEDFGEKNSTRMLIIPYEQLM